jgi:hypothetical protein
VVGTLVGAKVEGACELGTAVDEAVVVVDGAALDGAEVGA